MMQGRRHWRPPHGKVRAMACSGNPRALPDLRAGAAAADPTKAAAQGQVQVSARGFRMSLHVGAILKLIELER